MTLTIEELNRRILLKRQLVAWTLEDIAELERKKALTEVEQDEKPCRVWVLIDYSSGIPERVEFKISKAGGKA